MKSRNAWLIVASVELILAALIVARPFVFPLNYRLPLGRSTVSLCKGECGPGDAAPYKAVAATSLKAEESKTSAEAMMKLLLDRVNHLETVLSSTLFSLLISTTLAVGGGAYTIKDKRIPISGLTVFVGANLVYVLLSAHYYFMLTHFYSAMIFLIDQNGVAGIKHINLLWIEFELPTTASSSWIPQIAYLIQATLAPLFFETLAILGLWAVFLRDVRPAVSAGLTAKHTIQLAPGVNPAGPVAVDLLIVAEPDTGSLAQEALPFVVVFAAIAFHILMWASMIWAPFWDFFMALHCGVRTL